MKKRIKISFFIFNKNKLVETHCELIILNKFVYLRQEDKFDEISFTILFSSDISLNEKILFAYNYKFHQIFLLNILQQ